MEQTVCEQNSSKIHKLITVNLVVYLTQLSIVRYETHIKESNITQFCKNLK